MLGSIYTANTTYTTEVKILEHRSRYYASTVDRLVAKVTLPPTGLLTVEFITEN
jgi:hypothetical protein